MHESLNIAFFTLFDLGIAMFYPSIYIIYNVTRDVAVVWVFGKSYRIRLWLECIGSRIFSSLFTHLFLVATRFKHCVTVISCLYHSFLCEQYLLVIYLSWWLKINNLSICGIYIIICRIVHRICCTVQIY